MKHQLSSGLRRRGGRFSIAILTGALAGALLISLRPPSAPAVHALLHQPRIRLEQNKRPLSKRELAVLTVWAIRYADCARARGAALGKPVVGKNEVIVAATGGARIQIGDLAGCDAKLGLPPLHSSLVLARDDGRLHLFRARTCALPPKAET